MKTPLQKMLFIALLIVSCKGLSQGWVAEIDIDLNHDLYALEKINSAVLNFSGVTVNGSSATSKLHFTVSGADPMSGNISLSASGIAWEPYDRANPYSDGVSAFFSGVFRVPCETGFFEKQGGSPQEKIYIWIRIYPRLEVSSFLQQCDQITLTSETCSPRYSWEVSDSPTSGFRTITGKASSSIVITRDELVSLGFSNPFGRKYFRVTGVNKTTSLLQPIDIYYPGPSVNATTSEPRCHDGNDGTAAITISTSVPAINDFIVTLFSVQSALLPLRQEVLTDASSFSFGGLRSGSYLVRVENATNINTYGNCWSDISFELRNPDAVTISSAQLSDYNGFQVRCNGSMDGRIALDASGGTGTYPSFEWIPSVSRTGIAENIAEGTYTVRVQDTHGCWSKPESYRLAAPPALAVSLISVGGANGFGVSCHDKADGAIETDVAGGVEPYTFAWEDGNTLDMRNALATGTYSLQVKDRNGCSVEKQITLAAPLPISFDIREISGITCAGAHSGILEVESLVNTIGETTYRWNTGEQMSTLSNKAAGAYSVTVTDNQGCTATRSHILKDAPAYSVTLQVTSDFSGQAIRCHGDYSGSLQAIVKNENGEQEPADHYTWFKNGVEFTSGTSLSALLNLGAGIYRTEIRYRSECLAESSFVLQDPAPLQLTISNTANYHGSDVSCAGRKDGALIATGSGGTGTNYTFLWSDGRSTPELSQIGAGTYSVVLTDINGCTATAQKTVTEPDPLIALIEVDSDYNGQAISCTGARDGRISGLAEGGTQPFSYQWNTGQRTSSLTGAKAGDYTLTIRDANGCTTYSSHTLSDPEPVIASIIESSNYNWYSTTCNGSRDGYLFATAVGGTGNYSYNWHDSQHSLPRYDNLGVGRYTVTVTDQNGCSHSLSTEITEPPLLSIHVSNVKSVSCHGGNDGQLSLQANGGVEAYTFSHDGEQWSDVPTIGTLRAGIYSLDVRDGNGCQQSTTASIMEPPPLVITLENITPALCGDPRGAVTSVASGGTGAYSFQWTNEDGLLKAATAEISQLNSGLYTVLVTDGNLCKASRAVAIPAADGPVAEVAITQLPTCSYSKDGGASVDILSGAGPFTITWSNGEHRSLVTNLIKGEYHVGIKDVNGCLTVKPVIMPGPDSLQIDATEVIEPTCHGSCDGSISVVAHGGNGGNTFIWDSATGPVLENLCAGSYQVTVSDRLGCGASKRIDLRQPKPITVDLLSQRDPVCNGTCDGILEIKATGGTGALDIQWSDLTTGTLVDSLCSGIYTALVTDANFCRATRQFTLTDPLPHFLDLGESEVICAGQTYTLDGGPSWQTFSWTSSTGFSSSNRMLTISQAGTYWLEARDAKNCLARDTFRLETSSDLLKAGFLLSSEVLVGDTLVIIDISWPLPENVSWIFPNEMQLINRLGDIIYGQFNQAGQYEVTLVAMSGDCRDALTKGVIVLDSNKPESAGGRVSQSSLLKEFSLYPNPNDGMFDVDVEFDEETPVTLTIWNALTSRMVARLEDVASKKYFKHLDLRPLSAGPYTLRLDYSTGSRYIRFIVR